MLKTQVVDGVAVLVERAYDLLPLQLSLVPSKPYARIGVKRTPRSFSAEVLLVFKHDDSFSAVDQFSRGAV